jgi:hypothetical protein
VLHTWGSALTHHPHLNCVVPGGGISSDGKQWLSCRPGYYTNVWDYPGVNSLRTGRLEDLIVSKVRVDKYGRTTGGKRIIPLPRHHPR